MLEADDIEALPHTTPTAVLELMEIGLSPTDAVTRMIRDAMTVAEGEAPDIDDLRDVAGGPRGPVEPRDLFAARPPS